MIPSLMSEKQEAKIVKDKNLKCGRIMWASIAFSLYAALYIAVIIIQIETEKMYWYNSAISGVIIDVETTNDTTIADVHTYQQLNTWLIEAFNDTAVC